MMNLLLIILSYRARHPVKINLTQSLSYAVQKSDLAPGR